MRLLEKILARPDVWQSPVGRELAAVMTGPVVISSAGYPYIQQPAWTRLRDWIPHILSDGPTALAAVDLVVSAATEAGATEEELANLRASERVVRQVVLTAAVTAPTELWLLRHVLSALVEVGVSDRLLAGESIGSDRCDPLVASELRIDLRFLLARGYVVRMGESVRLPENPTARHVLETVRELDAGTPPDAPALWARAIRGEAAADDLQAIAWQAPEHPPPREPGRWHATAADIELGYRLVPLVLGLVMEDRVSGLVDAGRIDAGDLSAAGEPATAIFRAAGVIDDSGAIGVIGRRVLERGPGPFGIIAAYEPYMTQLPDILRRGRGEVSVRRGHNIAASQAANRRTFEKANDALDRLCEATGFTYDVFIEHAVGKGEASRQRFERSGDDSVRYFGADLEDPAIDAAIAERDAGRLPAGMQFIRHADIGRPDVVLDGVRAAGADPDGAVMIVGNGFHEVRDQTDASMSRVFAGYERAGVVLIFTEESALPIDALLRTAWNTYHAGFRYVHERSGQGLRPAVPSPPSPLEGTLPASWTECAQRAGYVRASAFCSRTRTIYPHTPPTGHNPAISVTHVFVPGRIAERLALAP